MAWNKYYIFINPIVNTDISNILLQLNLSHYKPLRQVPFHQTNKPKTLFAGFFNSVLLLVHPELPFEFFHKSPTETEKRLTSVFPDAEIGVIFENGTVNMFGFTLIQNGKRIRMKNGCEGEIYNDEGEQLPEEKEMLSETIFCEDEIDSLKQDGMSEEAINSLIKFEAGWRIPDRLIKRFLGSSLSGLILEKPIMEYTKDNFANEPPDNKQPEIRELINYLNTLGNS